MDLAVMAMAEVMDTAAMEVTAMVDTVDMEEVGTMAAIGVIRDRASLPKHKQSIYVLMHCQSKQPPPYILRLFDFDLIT